MGILNCSNKGPGPLHRGHNHKNGKMGLGHIKILFSRTIGPNLTRLGTNHPLREGILNSSNEGDCLSPRGDNAKKLKIH
jgi:hypothetical protein